jgi:hypothetical protein
MMISRVTNCAGRQERKEWDAQSECAHVAEEAGIGEDGGCAAAGDDHVEGPTAVSTRCVCVSEIQYNVPYTRGHTVIEHLPAQDPRVVELWLARRRHRVCRERESRHRRQPQGTVH